MTNLKPVDVAIIGGGWSGLAMAKELTTRTSQSVLVLERGIPRKTLDYALDMDELASVTKRPEYVAGTHFFSPANVMKLLEVVRPTKASPETLLTASQGFSQRLYEEAAKANSQTATTPPAGDDEDIVDAEIVD